MPISPLLVTASKDAIPLLPGADLLDALRGADPDQLTPLDALKKLAEWKKKFG